ncbi:hydroxyacid dehydrogenase [Chromatiales bacterium (ex Bugula neritina AB1)]|nr:hydroxyacid dehydrogenase [Chromatiales bacterium (ex Bugula neritina AB1)]
MKILIADSFPEAYRSVLAKSGHEITFSPDLDADSLSGAIGDNEALIVRSTKVQAETLKAGENLKLVIRAGAGTNTIDKSFAAESGIRVCNVPGANAVAVAELAMGLILSIDRNIPDGVSDLNKGIWAKKKYSKAQGLLGQKIAILGLGSIGFAVAERANAFGMEVFALAKPNRSAAAEQRIKDAQITQLDSMDELLAQCDIISLHMPATDETRNLVNPAFLEKMKESAMLINTSRGELIDEAALLQAMQSKGIRVGLDVYNNEPGAADSTFSSEIATHPAVCSTHHIGASTEQAQNAVAEGVVDVIAAYTEGEFKNCVN